MQTIIDGLVNGAVEGLGLATTEGHVGDGTLVLGLASGSKLLTSSFELGLCGLGSKVNTSNNVAHGTTSVATEDLDSDDMCSLGNTVLGRSNGTRAVSTVTVAVLINVIQRNGLSPGSPTLELLVADVDAGVDDVDINTLTALLVEKVPGEGRESKLLTMAYTSQTL